MNLRDLLKLLPIERFRNPPPVVTVVRFDGVIVSRESRNGVSLGQSRRGAGKSVRARPGSRPSRWRSTRRAARRCSRRLLGRRIRQLADDKGVPVFAFAEDVAASGGYWLALAADEIYGEEASLLGSIGVVTASFGVDRLIERYGIERRLHTAGDRKSLLDPFLPEDPSDVARLRALQHDIHDSFKEHVRRRRAGKIDPADDTLFSGEVLTGRMALARGLIDGIGDVRSVMRARFGDNVRLVPISHQRRRRWWLPRLGPLAGPTAPGPVAAAAAEILDWLEARALWARFGL